MSRLTLDETAEPVSRDQILRRERGQGNIIFPCSADHVQDWQPYPVDPYSANGKSLSWTGLTREWWCCTVDLVSRLDMSTCQTSIKADILLVHC